ncbi:DNA-processing protein DprA [Paenibacillus macerans]|uniref:DNA-processing protein DprA n=1 Tax=Paenibacillus macerans TaxID=44252 RepID=UPI002E2085BF|nr:DNA-processing protein DprA [Paenibacillus macerans]MED4955126.1 DNA-processing protein DprA [Paenibacillus macerans]
MEKKWILVGLHESPGLGWKRIRGILSRPDWGEAPDFTSADWMERGLGSELAMQMSELFTLNWIESRLELMRRKRIQAITLFDEEYPLLMKETARPPWVLYTLGEPRLLSTLSVAVVGTRLPTAYGRKVAVQLAEELCAHGITVVSGLARGIDGISHEAALRAGGSTIAVLGTAIDVAYPPENASLYRSIAEQGLIVSEYPIGTPGHPGMFPRRNRIIAGISRGTVVVEADARSGSLITVDWALEANRDVFAVPGPITSPKSRGTLALLKQGAKIVTDAQDIWEEYRAIFPVPEMPVQTGKNANKLTDEERRIYHMLEQGNASFDELLVKTEWDFGLLHSVLLSLIMKKTVVQLPGSVYQLI